MTKQHTPGLWTATPYNSDWECAKVHLPSDETICDVFAPSNSPKLAELRARLIAAAPETAAERDRLKASNAELLAALIRAANTIDGAHGSVPVQIRAAIAAATQKPAT